LHKAYWKNEYYDEGEIKHVFVNQPIIDKNNDLDFFYNVIERNYPNIKTIELPNYIASAKHMWGLSPYHY
jgi:hypothetical protein